MGHRTRLLLLAACLAAALPYAAAHGYLRIPQSRNFYFW